MTFLLKISWFNHYRVVRILENLENLEKSGNFILVRENLENLELSGNFVDIAPKFFLITLLSNCLIMSKFLQHTFQYHMGPFRSLTGGSWVHIVINIVRLYPWKLRNGYFPREKVREFWYSWSWKTWKSQGISFTWSPYNPEPT